LREKSRGKKILPFFCLDISSTSTQVQKKQKSAPSLKLQRKRKARDCFLVRKPFTSYNSTSTEPFHPLLSHCFVGDFSTTSKKTRLNSALKPKHPSAVIIFYQHPE
jgi:hypothetical protein